MTEKELQIRIEKKQYDIEKIQKRISKWTAGMNDEAKTIAAACEVPYGDPEYKSSYEAFSNYEKSHKNDPTVFNKIEWNKGPQLDEAYRAYRDLAEAKKTLNKYEVALNKEINYQKEEKIEVIWNFLQSWRKQAYTFFLTNIKLYSEKRSNQTKAYNEFEQSEEFKQRLARKMKFTSSENYAKTVIRREWFEEYFEDIHPTTLSVYLYNGKWDDQKLNKILDKEVHRKYTSLINQITKEAGEILDATNLHLDQKGDLAGTVIGTKNTVEVWTTLSGGYNIQCLHFRSYCHPVRR